MSTPRHWTKSTLIFGGAAAWGLLLVSCVVADRTVVAPPVVAGATFVGSKKCAECHEEHTANFVGATHSKIAMKDAKGVDIGCESCHGGGSLHVKAGGSKATIANPSKSPETCFACHLDKRGEFSLPHAHPVLSGQVTCNDCHNPHKGHVVKRSGAELETPNETCTKMLVARDANLCLRCHLEHPAVEGNSTIMAGGEDHRTRLQGGTCWIAGCHEDVHGSNASKAMRY
jgi:hypothetical protein